MSKTDYCIHFVDLSHLTAQERRDAAFWALDRFNHNDVDVMHPKEVVDTKTYYHQLVPGFWFAHEKDAVFFTLRWSSA